MTGAGALHRSVRHPSGLPLTPTAMLCLHEDVAARLEILYGLPVSCLRLRGESKEERDHHRRSDLSLALCGNECLNNPTECRENLARFPPVHVFLPLPHPGEC